MDTRQLCSNGELDIEFRIRKIIQFLKIYRWIIEAYVSDFFVLGHWKNLPVSWQNLFSQLSAPELSCLIDSSDGSHDRRHVWPLSLLCYKACTGQLSLSRQVVDVGNVNISERLKGKKCRDPQTNTRSDYGETHAEGQCQLSCPTDPEPQGLIDPEHQGSTDSQHQGHTDRKHQGPTDSEHQAPTYPKHQAPTDPEHLGPTDSKRQRPTDLEHQGRGFFCGQYRDLYHIYRRHVKPKKQHEIHQLGQVVQQLSEMCGSGRIVDVGAGLGHLSRLLTFGLGFKVTTVEASEGHAPKATTFDREMDSEIRKKRLKMDVREVSDDVEASADKVTLPSHIVHWIEPSVSMDQFIKMLSLSSPHTNTLPSSQPAKETVRPYDQELYSSGTEEKDCSAHHVCSHNQGNMSLVCKENAGISHRKRHSQDTVTHFQTGPGGITQHLETESRETITTEQQGDSGPAEQFILCGLHACGNLTATLLRLFVHCPRAVALNSVGCCYMKLSCESAGDPEKELGYPMSDFVRGISDHRLSYAGLEMACHFIDSYKTRLKENRANLIVHSYRAALQQIILEKNPGFQRGARKITVKRAEQMDFTRYAEMGLQKIGLDPTLTDAQLTEAQRQISQWKDVVVFYTIRLALAPLIETLVLLDRVQYLREQGIHSTLLPVFDPTVSPRNFALLATKSPQDTPQNKGDNS